MVQDFGQVTPCCQARNFSILNLGCERAGRVTAHTHFKSWHVGGAGFWPSTVRIRVVALCITPACLYTLLPVCLCVCLRPFAERAVFLPSCLPSEMARTGMYWQGLLHCKLLLSSTPSLALSRSPSLSRCLAVSPSSYRSLAASPSLSQALPCRHVHLFSDEL